MLFENRNKEYGAYDLRVNYEKRLVRSFGLALLIAGFFFLVPYALTQILREKLKPKMQDDGLVYDFNRTFVIENEVKPHSIPAPKTNTVSTDATYKVVSKAEEKKIPEQKPADPDPSSSQNSGAANVLTGNDSTLLADGNGFDTDSVSSEPMSIATVEVIPEFPGGEKALLKFMGDNIQYPGQAWDFSITGKVYVSFVINEQGKTESIRIMHSLGYGIDEEVIRVIGLMPDWKPGRYHNQKVKTSFVMPVSFSLK